MDKQDTKSNLPAIDDLDLRKQNTERIIGSVEGISGYFKKTEKLQMWNLIMQAGWIILLILFFSLIYGNAIAKGGLDSIIDSNSITRRFNCTAGDTSDILRSYDDAESFLKIWGGTCRLYQVNTND